MKGLAELDPSVVSILNAGQATRDVFKSMGVPSRSIRSEKEVAEMDRQRQEQEQAMAAMQMGGAAVQGLQGMANAEKALQESQAVARGVPGGMAQ